MYKGSVTTLASVLFLGIAGMTSAQTFDVPIGSFKFPDCADADSSKFKPVILVDKLKVPDLVEPVKFAVAKDGRVFFGERNGGVRVVETTGVVVKLGSVPVWPLASALKFGGNNELGLSGLTLDPNFETNGWIYITYQPTSPDVSKIVRLKVSGTTLGPEQILMEFPLQKNYCCHTGGDLKFDNKGDLWISVGNNTRNPADAGNRNGYVDTTNKDSDDQGHAANTNDYRGKILRIHPLPAAGSDGKLYTIPAGNLKEAYATLWTDAEKAKVLPEIYTMGHRSNYTITVDTLKGWLTWGDIGPDEGRLTEELNLTAKPGFFGWPYFAGAKRTTAGDTYSFTMDKDENAPMNTSPNNTGVKKLPPAIPATFGYFKSAAITGSIYHYSSNQTSAKKLPPHFDGKWFIGDLNWGAIQAATLDANGNITARTGFLKKLVNPLQITIGPDGMLYILEYGDEYFKTKPTTAIKRWEYTGPACIPGASLADRSASRAMKSGTLLNFGFNAELFVTLPEAVRGFRLYDLQGKLAWETPAGSPNLSGRRVTLPSSLGNGVYRVKFEY